jgi:hypothetical protein
MSKNWFNDPFATTRSNGETSMIRNSSFRGRGPIGFAPGAFLLAGAALIASVRISTPA